MKIEAASLGPFETNAYLLSSDDGKECIVIDAPQGAAAKLLPLIKDRGLKLTHLLLTHGHWDHMCEAHAFAAAGAEVLAHRADRELIENIEAYKDRYLAMLPELSDADFKSVKVTTWLEEGSTFVAAGKAFETRHVPATARAASCSPVPASKWPSAATPSSVAPWAGLTYLMATGTSC